MKLVIAFPLMLFAFAGCSSSSSGSGGYMAVPTVHESSAPACHDVSNVASAITTEHVQGSMPAYTAAGGSIPDGVYVLTSQTIYQSTPPEGGDDSTSLTVVVDGSKWYLDLNDGLSSERRETTDVSIASSSFNGSSTCPFSGGGYFAGNNDFTSSSSGFIDYAASADGLGAVLQFTRK